MKTIYISLITLLLSLNNLFAQDSVYVFKSNYPVFKESVDKIDSMRIFSNNSLFQCFGNSNALLFSSRVSSVDSVTYTPSAIPATPLGIRSYTGLSIGATSNTSIGCYLNASTSRTFTLAGSAAKCDSVDLGVGYSTTTPGLFLIAPTDVATYVLYDASALGTDRISLWNTRNPTVLRMVDTSSFLRANFDAITTGNDIKAVFDTAIQTPVSPNTETKVFSMGIGKSLAFKTIDGKYGVLWVTGASGSPAASRKMVIDYKITD